MNSMAGALDRCAAAPLQRHNGNDTELVGDQLGRFMPKWIGRWASAKLQV